MKKFVLRGGAPLYGDVPVSGAKNAALPLLFATMLTRGVSRFDRVPAIGDVDVALSILSSYGARIERAGERVLIDTEGLYDVEPAESFVRAIRASSYLLGGALGRFGRVTVRSYGGCNFADRPIDMHLAAARALGAQMRGDELTAAELRGADIFFPKCSVGATVNALLLACTAEGTTHIRGAAQEPHIDALIAYLNAAGASVFRERDCLTVCGAGRLLDGACATVIPDAIEAGTYLLAAPLTGGRLRVTGCDPSHLCGFLPVLECSGVGLRIGPDSIEAWGRASRAAEAVASPHPGFPTDLQPQTAVLFSRCGGRIRDLVFPARFGYLEALARFGLRSERGEGNARVLPSSLIGAEVFAPDLRGGAACVLAALAAEGESAVLGADVILRGYPAMAEKLSAVGAGICLA